MYFNHELLCTIQELGKDLTSINLLIACQGKASLFTPMYTPFVSDDEDETKPVIEYIIEGCPKLKSLTLESFSDDSHDFNIHENGITISKKNLKALSKGCKELKELKLNKVLFSEIADWYEIDKILPYPNYNVEIDECEWDEWYMSEDSYDSDDLSNDYDSENSEDVSFDDEEQDSNSERAYESDKTNNSENYGENNKDENGD